MNTRERYPSEPHSDFDADAHVVVRDGEVEVYTAPLDTPDAFPDPIPEAPGTADTGNQPALDYDEDAAARARLEAIAAYAENRFDIESDKRGSYELGRVALDQSESTTVLQSEPEPQETEAPIGMAEIATPSRKLATKEQRAKAMAEIRKVLGKNSSDTAE